MQGNPVPAPPPKKKMSGCLTAFLIVSGFFIVVGLVVGFLIYRYFTVGEGKKVVAAVGSGVELTKESMNAPGTAELRASGCEQAMAMDVEKMGKIVEGLAADGGKPLKGDIKTVVTCQVPLGKTMSCENVAATYAKAANPTAYFSVTVSRRGNNRLCYKSFDSDGTFISDLDARGSGSKPPSGGAEDPGEE
jgi:hypothetical protein